MKMRNDTPPHSFGGDGGDAEELERRLEFDDVLDEEDFLIDDDENDFEGEDGDDDDDDLDEVELEELERRLNGVDDSLFTFIEHVSPVFSCHIHPEHDIAVTGGQDDVAYVWHLDDGQVIQKITQLSDTVIVTKFSHDGNYLLTADMAGNIFVFRLQVTAENGGPDVPGDSEGREPKKPKVTLTNIWWNSMGDMSWCFWHDRSNVVFGSSAETGEIYYWRIPSGECKVLIGSGCCCAAGQLTADGKELFASYYDGKVRLWDLRTGTVKFCVSDQHSKLLIPSIACDSNGPLFASGDINGKIMFWSQSGAIQSVQSSGLIECLAFSPSSEMRMLASATLEGETTIWDSTHFTKRVTCSQPQEKQSAICSMKWLNDLSLAIGTDDGDIMIFDARNGALIRKLVGHRAHVYEFYYCRRNNSLMTVSEDNTAKIFPMPELAH